MVITRVVLLTGLKSKQKSFEEGKYLDVIKLFPQSKKHKYEYEISRAVSQPILAQVLITFEDCSEKNILLMEEDIDLFRKVFKNKNYLNVHILSDFLRQISNHKKIGKFTFAYR